MKAFRLIASILLISAVFSDAAFSQESKEELAKAAPQNPIAN